MKTKQNYIKTLHGATEETLSRIKKFPDIGMYNNIHIQLVFIIKIIEEGRIPSEIEKERLTLGAIAMKNFDGYDDDYSILLKSLYGGFLRYDSLA